MRAVENEARDADPAPIAPSPGLADPRPIPTGLDSPEMEPLAPPSNESPDVDPPAWEGAEPGDEGRGLLDPRPEIPMPEGL